MFKWEDPPRRKQSKSWRKSLRSYNVGTWDWGEKPIHFRLPRFCSLKWRLHPRFCHTGDMYVPFTCHDTCVFQDCPSCILQWYTFSPSTIQFPRGWCSDIHLEGWESFRRSILLYRYKFWKFLDLTGIKPGITGFS